MNELIALQGKNFDPRGVEADVLQNQMRQQSLQSGQFDMQQKQEAIARQNQMRNMLQSLPQDMTPEQVTNALVRAGSPEMAGTYIKSVREAGKAQNEGERARREASKFTQDQAIASIKHLSQTFGALSADPTVTHSKVVGALVDAHRNGLLPPNTGQEQISQIMAMDDAQLKQYLKTMQLKGVDLEKQLEMQKVNFAQVDNGGAIETQAQNPYSGDVRVVASRNKVATPDARLSSGTQVQVAGMNIAGRAAEGEKDRAVTVRGQDLKGAEDKPLTDSQSKALLFSTRMEAADKILGDLSAKGTTKSVPGSQVPMIGRAINSVTGADNQMLNQAKKDFLTAVLRRESGAVISDSEMANGDQQYFPQIGDSEEVIKQKAENRRIAREGIAAEVPDKKKGISKDILSGGKQGGGDPNVLKYFGKK